MSCSKGCGACSSKFCPKCGAAVTAKYVHEFDADKQDLEAHFKDYLIEEWTHNDKDKTIEFSWTGPIEKPRSGIFSPYEGWTFTIQLKYGADLKVKCVWPPNHHHPNIQDGQIGLTIANVNPPALSELIPKLYEVVIRTKLPAGYGEKDKKEDESEVQVLNRVAANFMTHDKPEFASRVSAAGAKNRAADARRKQAASPKQSYINS